MRQKRVRLSELSIQDPPAVEFSAEGSDTKIESFKVVSDVGVSVPACSVLYLNVSFRGKPDTDKHLKNYFFDPSQKLFLDKGLCVGKAVVNRETSMLPVVDFSRETQWLEKGTVVGSIEIAGEVDESQLNDIGEIPSEEAGELNFDSRISNNLSRKQRKKVCSAYFSATLCEFI